MDKEKIKAYLTVAKKVCDCKDHISASYIYTCNELQYIHPEAYKDYVDLYFNDWSTRDNQEDNLWRDSKYLTERRLLMLCLAAAIEETGGL